MKLNYGDIAAQKVSERIAEPVATLTDLKGIPADRRVAGMTVLVTADQSRWRFHATSALTGDDALVVAPTAGSGRWLLMPGGCTLVLPITFATADAAVLLTMQAGQEFLLLEPFHKVTADWTGGTASTIGVSSNKTNFTAKGDILGGVAGAAAAALTAAISNCFGTIGTGFDTLAKRRVALFAATDTIRHDRITSAFTAGAGSVNLMGILRRNDGA